MQEEKFPLPTTDQLPAEHNRTTIYCKLSCNSSFYQIVLPEKSQEFTMLITPYKRYCFKCLPFLDKFCTRGVISDINDILISRRNQQEHDQQLRVVLQKMKAAVVVISYIDDVLISGRNLQENNQQVRVVLQRMKQQE